MPRRLSWSDVRGGFLAVVVIVGLSLATLKYARVGALHGRTVRLYALVSEARGILKGSEVWLSGQVIGKVADIQFRSPAIADTTVRVLLVLDVLDKYRPAMSRDAVAQVRSGGSLIGAVVVYVSPGTLGAGEIRDGDTLRARPQADVEGASSQLGVAAREFPAIMNSVKELRGELQSTRGTLGAVLNEGMAQRGALQRTAANVGRLHDRVAGGRGTVGKVMSGDLGARAHRVMARTDSVRALLASSSTSFGRFRRDSTLVSEVADIQKELSKVRALLDSSQGTAGRVLHDSAVTRALGDAQREMGLLFADLKKHPLRYNPF
jgi:ABC-type transporter Mla subunit MlaD